MTEERNRTKYTIQGFNAGTFWVPKPEVYWMHGWGEREEMNLIIFLVQGGGKNILINTGPPRDLSIINKAWFDFFGFDEARIARAEAQRPEQILQVERSQPRGYRLGDRHAPSGLCDRQYPFIPESPDLYLPQGLD